MILMEAAILSAEAIPEAETPMTRWARKITIPIKTGCLAGCLAERPVGTSPARFSRQSAAGDSGRVNHTDTSVVAAPTLPTLAIAPHRARGCPHHPPDRRVGLAKVFVLDVAGRGSGVEGAGDRGA